MRLRRARCCAAPPCALRRWRPRARPASHSRRQSAARDRRRPPVRSPAAAMRSLPFRPAALPWHPPAGPPTASRGASHRPRRGRRADRPARCAAARAPGSPMRRAASPRRRGCAPGRSRGSLPDPPPRRRRAAESCPVTDRDGSRRAHGRGAAPRAAGRPAARRGLESAARYRSHRRAVGPQAPG